MTLGDEHIAAEADASAEPGESMDVLLQLTLPIVLILAFVVVTEVKTLTDQMWRLKRDIQNTATGRLSRERDTTLMELQLQLLYQATDQVAQAEEEALSLREYRLVAPDVPQILEGQVNEGFGGTSRTLHELFDGADRRERTERRLRAEVEERFAGLVKTELTELDEDARKKVMAIQDVHRELYETKLEGYIERFEKTAAAVQLDLMLKWLENPAVSTGVQGESLSLWARIQRQLVAGDQADVPFDEFVNLRASRLVQELAALNVPLLERATREARL
jgi:hypothetical protein